MPQMTAKCTVFKISLLLVSWPMLTLCLEKEFANTKVKYSD